MSRRGSRRRVDRGIYRDAIGFEVVARAQKRSRSARFPADAELDELRAWRDTNTADLHAEDQPTDDRTTLTGAIDRFMKKTHLTRAPDKAALEAWRHEFGALPRRKLKPALVAQAFERWRAMGYSAQSLYYRRLMLEKLWKTLDGPHVRTPVDGIRITRPKAKRPLWVSDDVILEVLMNLRRQEMAKRLRTPKTRARLLVLVTTGQRPAQLKRAARGDVTLYREPQQGIWGVWWVRAAKGGEPVPVYLNQEMRQAWEAFIVANAWGEYNTRSFARTLRYAGWPAGIRPYHARHAVGIALSERGVDLADIQSHFGHTDISTTRGYYVPQLHSRLQQLSGALEGRFSGDAVARQRGTPRKS